uniref:Uncharacterized protein n=1 Tax=Chenopodium quinoa TaxID=63459 RepID=A0A803NA86_CHEQI
MYPKFTEISQSFERFKATYVRNDFDTSTRLLSQLKIEISWSKSECFGWLWEPRWIAERVSKLAAGARRAGGRLQHGHMGGVAPYGSHWLLAAVYAIGSPASCLLVSVWLPVGLLGANCCRVGLKKTSWFGLAFPCLLLVCCLVSVAVLFWFWLVTAAVLNLLFCTVSCCAAFWCCACLVLAAADVLLSLLLLGQLTLLLVSTAVVQLLMLVACLSKIVVVVVFSINLISEI